MSRALFERAASGRHSASSAGTSPASQIHGQVAEAMRDLGFDLDGAVPRRLTDELAAQADVVVTMGCGDACPYIPGKRYVDWDLADPADMAPAQVRALADEIETRVAALVAELDGEDSAPSQSA